MSTVAELLEEHLAKRGFGNTLSAFRAELRQKGRARGHSRKDDVSEPSTLEVIYRDYLDFKTAGKWSTLWKGPEGD